MNEKSKQPEIIVFAGPNGSGKSTITKTLRPLQIDYINADDIKRVLLCDDEHAAIEAEKQREEHLKLNLDFCFETVLSTRRNIDLLKRAKDKGYFIRCYYVLTFDPNINVQRVASRVQQGGHDVPKEKIISRYERSLDLVKELVPLCDVCHIYDNSTFKPYRIFKKRKKEYFYCTLRELWHKEDIQLLTGIYKIERAKLNG